MRPPPAGGKGERPERRRGKGTVLGHAEDAGHPGGFQDLGAKRETEEEHDVWERHG